ncbi:Cytochrome P450 monooxygenase gsfF [Colletotrichum tropicale]|nr:Cytochrome P450 monooxygenase gsfF [Colletotrichum tropicale]
MSFFNCKYIALLGAVVLYIVAISILRALRPGLRQIPGPWIARYSPIWRMMFVWNGDAHERYRELHAKYGPIVRTAPNVVDISDPSAMFTIYGIGSKFLKSAFYHTLSMAYEGKNMPSMFSTTDPEEHKALKRPVAQKFSMSSIRTLEYLVDPCSQIFTDAMLDMQGQVVDLGNWVQWYAFDVIGAISFARRFGFMEERKDIKGMIAGIEFGLVYVGRVGQVPSLHPFLLGNLTLRRIFAKLVPVSRDPIATSTKMVLEGIKEYDAEEADTTHRRDFLAYLRQQQKSTGTIMSTWELMNHLMNNLLAGSDTTAISLRAVFYYLLKNKHAYQTLQQEIDNADRDGKLSPVVQYSESLELEYLQLCIKEAMRMHPGVSYPLERIVPEGGVELCGVHLPAGTVVGMNAAVVHRNYEIFGQDADEFRPERWLCPEEKAKNMDRHLLTFGAGARTCIGKNISIMEVGKFVPQVLRQFDLEWASSEPEWKVKTYWFAKQSGLLVKFTPRSAASKQQT